MSFPRERLFHLIPKRGPTNDDVTLLREDDSSVSPNQHMRRIGDDPIQLMHPTFILVKKLRPRNDNHAGFVSRPQQLFMAPPFRQCDAQRVSVRSAAAA